MIVTNMSYENGSTDCTFTLQPKHVLLSKREKEGVDMRTLQAKGTKAFLTNWYLSISAVANIYDLPPSDCDQWIQQTVASVHIDIWSRSI